MAKSSRTKRSAAVRSAKRARTNQWWYAITAIILIAGIGLIVYVKNSQAEPEGPYVMDQVNQTNPKNRDSHWHAALGVYDCDHWVGDGSGAACPCGNAGAAGHGCASSVDPSGARLSASGTASVAADTLVLAASGMPNSSCLYFQGTSASQVPFGDGIRCAGGSVVRLGTRANAGGASQYPGPGQEPVSVRGAVAPGDARVYQAWYRNAAAFCTASTFNLSNAYALTWAP